MPFPFAELTMLMVICTLVCLIVFGLVYVATRQARGAESTENERSDSRIHVPSLESALYSTMFFAPEQYRQEEDSSSGISGQRLAENAFQQSAFTPAQTDRLLRYRAAYHQGYYHPDPLLPRRLAFAKWLYQQGKISG
jgi:hypothetical protein